MDLDVLKPESVLSCHLRQVGLVKFGVLHPTATQADQVMVVARFEVESRRTGPQVDLLELALRGQCVQGVVDGLERDGRHLSTDRRVDSVGAGVDVWIGMEDLQDALSLGG